MGTGRTETFARFPLNPGRQIREGGNNNKAVDEGGGIYCYETFTPVIKNNIICIAFDLFATGVYGYIKIELTINTSIIY